MRLKYIVWMWLQGERVIAKGNDSNFLCNADGKLLKFINDADNLRLLTP